MVVPLCADVIVTACEARTPLLKLPLVTGAPAIVAFELSWTVPLNDVTVLLLASCAVTRMLNALPAVWVAMLPPPAASTRKWARVPEVLVRENEAGVATPLTLAVTL